MPILASPVAALGLLRRAFGFAALADGRMAQKRGSAHHLDGARPSPGTMARTGSVRPAPLRSSGGCRAKPTPRWRDGSPMNTRSVLGPRPQPTFDAQRTGPPNDLSVLVSCSASFGGAPVSL